MIPTTISGWLAIAPLCGLPAGNFVPASLWDLAGTVAERNVPVGATAGPSGPAPNNFVINCQAFLIARGIIYYKSAPGDCGSPSRLDFGNVQLTASAGSAVSGIASMAGAALPGIGVAVQAIEEIFAHHAQAVYTEQQTICAVAGVINQVFNYYDAQVRAGRLSPSTAYAGLQNYIAQVNARLSTIEKTCNAACVYSGILAAHADFVKSYYPAIAPANLFEPAAPGAAPTVLGTTPGGVIQVGGGAVTLSPQGFAVSRKAVLIGLAVAAGIVLAIGVTK